MRSVSVMGPSDGEDFVMEHEWLPLEQEVIVLRVVAGDRRIGAGEPGDRVHRFPEGNEEVVGDGSLGSAEDLDSAIAGGCSVIGNAGSIEVGEVGVGFGGRHPAMPRASDHRYPSPRPGDIGNLQRLNRWFPRYRAEV